MAALAARHVEDARAHREREELDQPGDVPPVLRIAEERLVLGEVAGVEIGRPPLGRRRGARAQKNTGSWYSPNTVSIAARIS
jgi:hypothetical protein